MTWIVAGAVAAAVLNDPERFDLAHHFIRQHDLDLAAFNGPATLRIALLFAVFVTGYAAIGPSLPTPPPGFVREVDLTEAARLLWRVNLVFLGVTLIWVYLTAQQMGGIGAMIAMVQDDAYAARSILLDNKLFTGMRLLYAALPATGCLAAAILAMRSHQDLTRGTVIICVAVIVLNFAVLMILPIVMSQRLILLQFVLSGYVAACMVQGRLVARGLIPLALGLFYLTWVLHEAVTNPDIDRAAQDIGLQKMAFYAVNDLWNSFQPFHQDPTHTFGLFSLQFAMFFTLSDAYFYDLFASRILDLEAMRGGGEFSLFSAPFVDFGLFGASVYLVILGALTRVCFHLGQFRTLWSALYGQVAAALALSVHVNYLASQDFVFSCIVITLIMRHARTDRPMTRWVSHG